MSRETKRADLESAFSRFGTIDRVVTPVERNYSFIYFRDLESATAAREEMNGFRLHDRILRVDYSLTNRQHR